MRKFLARRALRAFSAHYGYDVGYMEQMLEISPSAFYRFAVLTKLAQQRQVAPLEAFYAAKLVGALAEDCGPCVQLVVDMAREAGLATAEIEAVLTRDEEVMSPETRLGFHFADKLLRRSLEADAAREAVRAQWGTAGVIDLTLALQIGRVFPMVKTGLGFGKTCQRVQLGGQVVEVAREAA